MSARYPQVHVRLCSRNPFAWVSGVRQALRRAGAGREEIQRFTAAALACREPEVVRQLCAAWVKLDLPGEDVAH